MTAIIYIDTPDAQAVMEAVRAVTPKDVPHPLRGITKARANTKGIIKARAVRVDGSLCELQIKRVTVAGYASWSIAYTAMDYPIAWNGTAWVRSEPPPQQAALDWGATP